MKANKVKPNIVFFYKGVSYTWITNENGNWAKLHYADGTVVETCDIPLEVLACFADVKVEGE